MPHACPCPTTPAPPQQNKTMRKRADLVSFWKTLAHMFRRLHCPPPTFPNPFLTIPSNKRGHSYLNWQRDISMDTPTPIHTNPHPQTHPPPPSQPSTCLVPGWKGCRQLVIHFPSKTMPNIAWKLKPSPSPSHRREENPMDLFFKFSPDSLPLHRGGPGTLA